MTCSDMGGAHNKPLRANHLSPGEPPLSRPSQTNDSNTGLTNAFEEPQKTYSANGKRYSINGKLGANNGWKLQQGWSEGRIANRTNTTLTPSPLLVKQGAEGAPVGSGTTLQDPNPTPNTPLEADHPGPAELSPDNSTQTQNFGIGNLLTEGTSDGNDREKEEDNGSKEQTQKQDEEPWKNIIGKNRGKSQNRSPATP